MDIEKIQVEVERLAGSNGAAIQVSGATHKRAGPVRKSAGTCNQGSRLEHARIRTAGSPLAVARSRALRHARDSTKNDAESAAQNVGRLPYRERNRVPRK